MTLDESTMILAVITAAFPNAYKNLSEEEAKAVVMVWAVQFKEIPADIVFMAVQKAIASNKFAPTIAEVKDKVRALHWEAYEAIRANNSLGMEAENAAEYKRIYELTEHARYKSAEPSIRDMVSASQRYLLSE